ncbi:MAG: glycosyltransferase [Planctomycetota bacterium]|nr:glycosyltransferase [Planctomycetota bacterium]
MSGTTDGNRPMPVRLSALIVNYESGALARACVDSLRGEWQREGLAPERLEIILVDNASPTDQAEHLAALEADGVRVLQESANHGYGGGMNRALAVSTGGPLDVVAVLNPDTVFLPGSLAPLLRTLALHPDCGAVGPRTSVDPAGLLELPPLPRPTAAEEAGAALAHLFPAWARRRSRRRTETARRRWTSQHPEDVEMLSGCCLFLRRDTLLQLERETGHELFDPSYPLYYEDADLCARLRSLGLRLVLQGNARIVHHWSRSAGHAQRFAEVAGPRLARSRARWQARHFKAHARHLTAYLEKLAARRAASGGSPAAHALTELGSLTAAPRLSWRGARPHVFEISLSPAFTLAAGSVGLGSSMTLPPQAWEWLFPARYFVRVTERGTSRLLGAWSFIKLDEARERPLSPAEYDAPKTSPASAHPTPSEPLAATPDTRSALPADHEPPSPALPGRLAPV